MKIHRECSLHYLYRYDDRRLLIKADCGSWATENNGLVLCGRSILYTSAWYRTDDKLHGVLSRDRHANFARFLVTNEKWKTIRHYSGVESTAQNSKRNGKPGLFLFSNDKKIIRRSAFIARIVHSRMYDVYVSNHDRTHNHLSLYTICTTSGSSYY